MVAQLLQVHRTLALTGLTFLLLTPFAVLGLGVDSRVLLGVPIWLKPLKFLLSSGIYCLTLCAILGCIRRRPRLVRIVGTGTALVLIVEIAIILFQAARGTTSHFNHTTRLDGFLFNAMGVSIFVLWALGVWTAGALFRQPMRDPALEWGLRYGLVIAALGGLLGAAMIVPRPVPVPGHPLLRHSSAHTVGAPDGGPGLPVVNWSRQHGDLRVAHFLGLHGLQLLPLLGWWLSRRHAGPGLVHVAAASYLSLILFAFVQALRRQSVLAPDRLMLFALELWFAGTIAGAVICWPRLTKVRVAQGGA